MATEDDAHEAYWQYDQLRQPGQVYANLSPMQRANLEADLLQKHGERPPAIDPVDILHARVEHSYDGLGA
jgi:hypothetical protein